MRFPIRHVSLVLVLVFYAALFSFTFHEADEDVWGRMAVGRLVRASATFPYEDVFAYVPTKSPWVDHEWLAGVAFYEVHRNLGGAGLVALRALLGIGALGLVYSIGRRRGGAFAAVVALASAALVLQGFNGVVRAQAFTFFLFAVFWYRLDRGGRGIWALPPLSALWANLHGGVVTGLALIGVYAVSARAGRPALVAVGALATAATLVTPYGFDYWRYLAGALSMPRPEIVEWRAVALTPLLDDVHVKLAALAVVVVVAGAYRALSWCDGIVLVGALAASWMHVRFAPFLAFAMVVALPRGVEALFEAGHAAFPKRWTPSAPPVAVSTLLLALFLTGAAVAWRSWDWVPRMSVPDDRYPVAAVESLASAPASGRLAVYFNWGEYALYHLHPRILVSVDGRYETVYPDAVVRANWDFTHGVPGGERLLESYPAEFALYPRDSGAARWLERSSNWKSVHLDDASVLYRNDKAGNR